MNPAVTVRPESECRFDLVSLGEVMLRLDPGEERIHTTRSFRVREGGGEYNVALGLSNCFGQRTALVTAFADNPVGRLLEGCVRQGGVDTSLITWLPYDGVGRSVRNGLNFTERGFGVRAAVGMSDRGHSAAGALDAGDVDWDRLFGEIGVRWLHTGGIYAGLSPTTAAVIEEAMRAARRHGTVVSYDLNYRESLWAGLGGRARAQEVNRRLAPFVHVMLGNEEDYTAGLGFQVPNTSGSYEDLAADDFKAMIAEVIRAHPQLAVAATTLRGVKTATINDWSAVAWSADTGFVEATPRPALEILDRVGGGDGFAAGLIYGLLEREDLAIAVEYGAAHGALVMTTPGDISTASLADVRRLMGGAGARIVR